MEKTYCPCHIREAAKAYNLDLKTKQKEEKEKQKEEKLKQKEEKLKQKALDKELLKTKKNTKTKEQSTSTKSENVVISQTNEIGAFVSDTSPQLCVAILKTGLRKGEECGLTGYNGQNMCKRHGK